MNEKLKHINTCTSVSASVFVCLLDEGVGSTMSGILVASAFLCAVRRRLSFLACSSAFTRASNLACASCCAFFAFLVSLYM